MSGCLKCEAVRPSLSLRGAEATKQSTLSLRGEMDCFVASAPRNDEARGLSQSAPPQLKRREHGLGDIGGAITAAEFHRLDAVGIDLVDRAFDALAGLGRAFEAVLVGQPVQHHGGGKNHPGRIGLALPHDVRRGAVAWLEYRVVV